MNIRIPMTVYMVIGWGTLAAAVMLAFTPARYFAVPLVFAGILLLVSAEVG